MNRAGIELPTGLDALPVIGILRRCPFANASTMAGAAVAAGLTVVEVTLDSERPLEQIAAIKAVFPRTQIGAGSVRRAGQVRAAVQAGAEFIVSPIVDGDTIRTAADCGIPCIPGAATPTEIDNALRYGATAVKVFPIEQLGGPGYLRAVLSPLGTPALIPTGGVGIGDVSGYLRSGAVAVGVGSSLFPSGALASGDVDIVANLARELIEAIS